jgi:hypothetical protein
MMSPWTPMTAWNIPSVGVQLYRAPSWPATGSSVTS